MADAKSEKPGKVDADIQVQAVAPVYFPNDRHGDSTASSSQNSSQNSSKVDVSTTETSLELGVKEREYPWSGYKEDPLPEKEDHKIIRNLRHQLFNLYRRLFSFIFFANMAIFIAFCVYGVNAQRIGTVLVSNLFTSILMRQDYIINAWFIIFTLPPKSWPLWIRLLCARVYHIGGIHSGCGVSGTVWLILLCGQATREHVTTDKVSVATLIMAYIVLALLISIIALAHPDLRAKYHNSFEMVHRFSGWTAVGVFWAFFILLTNDYRPEGESLARTLRKSPEFWLVVVLTFSIALPWMRLRKYPVQAEVLSNHALRLHFEYVDPIPGSFSRISSNPLFEWHSFATIQIPGKKGYSAIVSNAGDWTKKKIANPPEKLWIRGVPTFGVLRIVPMFRRIVIVATGSGIAPVTPHLLAQKTNVKLLWTSPDVRETFGDKFVDMVLAASPDAVIYNTRTHGKPDMVKLAYRVYKEYNAEAVAVISNPKLTYKLIYGLTSRGVPAFAPIFDS
ncbi:hypothetical protein CPB83DRAFT_883979 [Crepidotus variabilis]|uniref:Nonribosomal peptide synthetase 12 n=1 Tax=Crepidotus variabilis TaxID=179855 RepID=A0A9P6EEW6_9AGAR|nr:hypothetical protein CPB83DRAFT_883979 [Crepidotus variabilis]